MKWEIGFDAAATLRDLEKLQADVPQAAASAIMRAANSAVAQASTDIAARAGVPRWMITGVRAETSSGRPIRNSGARITRTRYIESIGGVYVIFRRMHINPVGTKRRQNKVTKVKRFDGVRVSAVKRTYDRAFHDRDGSAFKGHLDRYGGAIYSKLAYPKLRLERIELEPWASGVLLSKVRSVVPPEFKKRFEHEMNRRIARVESRAPRASKIVAGQRTAVSAYVG